MLDFGFTEMLVIAAVALLVIGPEKLPLAAREVGRYVGRAQRYIRQLQDEINRSAQLQDLQQMKRELEQSARELEQKIEHGATQLAAGWQTDWHTDADAQQSAPEYLPESPPSAAPPGSSDKDRHAATTVETWGAGGDSLHHRYPIAARKNWRARRGSIPAWYRRRQPHRNAIRSDAAKAADNRRRHSSRNAANSSSNMLL